MATYTEKLGLKLPSQTDFYNVDDFNENFRKIDQNTAQSGDIQQVLTLADPIRSNRAPTTADAQFAGKLWVVPKMIFNNMMPDALTQVASNWRCTASTSSASGSSATIVGDGTASTIVSEVDMTAVRANDIVYINAKMAVTADANGAIIELLCGDNVIATTSMSIPTAGDSAQLIDYIKVDEAGALKLRVTTMYNSASAQLGKGVTISDITILDLTADMCQNFAGIEFTKDETTAYINTYGKFQTKTYELSEYWWICRGSYGGQYSWQRYDDEINNYSNNYQRDKATTTEAQAGSNDSHWMTPLKTQQFLTSKIATQAEAQAGSDNTKVMTPLRVANQITAKIATQAEAQAGSVDTKIMTPLKTQQFLTNKLATQAEAYAGSNNTKVMTPARVKDAMLNALKVGDVLETYRTDLGEHWLLCDGGAFDADTYPQLAAIAPDFVSRLPIPSVTGVTGTPDCYLEANGYKAYSYRTSGTGCYVVYSTDNWKTYTRNLIANITSDSSGRNAASGLFYVNGYYILLVSGSGVTPGSLEVYYTTNITSTSWTQGATGSNYSYGHGWGKFYDLWYSGGTYYLAGAGSSDTSAGTGYAYVASATNPGFTSGLSVTKVYDSQMGVADFIRTSSRLAFVGYYSNTYHVLYSTPSAPKAYTHANFTISGTAPSSVYLTTGGLTYANGRYCFCGYTGSYTPVVVSTTDLTSAKWTGVSLNVTQSNNNYMPRGFVFYVRGKYYIPAYYVAGNSQYAGWYVGTSLTSSTGWTFYACRDSDITAYNVNYKVKPMETDGYLTLSVASAFLRYPIYALPAASDDTTYRYIKCKEVT